MDTPAHPPAGAGFTNDLHSVRLLAGPATQRHVFALVQAHAAVLADLFYEALFADPAAAPLLDRTVVNHRLRRSLQRWLLQLFDPAVAPDALAHVQRHTGEVHARVGVPIALAARGARQLKRAILARVDVQALERPALLQAAQYVEELLDLAVDTMAGAFAANSSRLARSEEAYRLFFLGQDMKAERERRRTELLEWAQQMLERHYWQPEDDEAAAAGPEPSSPFTVWLNHKAAMLFEGAAEVEHIQADMQRVECELLPRLIAVRADRANARAVVAEIHRCIDRIKDLLGSMFDRYLAAEDGRDSVTALLNRRYFPAVARREIEVARRRGSGFCVLLLDIDRFLQVAGTVGTENGNLVLAQTGALLQERLRAGDFVFRVGDDEFLALLVECNAETAMRVAESLRREIAGLRFATLGGGHAQVSVSVGVAPWDGHPDYQRLLDRADAALRQAKAAGRDRCALAD